MLNRAAATAARADLLQARQDLLAGRDLLPPAFLERRALVAAAAQWTDAMRDHAERADQVPDRDSEFTQDAVSLLRVSHEASMGPTAEVPVALPRHDGQDHRTGYTPQFGSRYEPPGDPIDAQHRPRYRPQPGAAEHQRERQDVPSQDSRRHSADCAGPSRGLWHVIVAGVALVALLGAGFLWWRGRTDELAVERVSVRVPADDLACDSTVEIVGIIETDGNEGEVHYRWIRNDDQQANASGEASNDQSLLSVTVPRGQTRTEVYLRWTFQGEGSFNAVITLEVLEPGSVAADAAFSYVCE